MSSTVIQVSFVYSAFLPWANGNHLPAALTCLQVRVLHLSLIYELLSDEAFQQR